MRSEEGRGNAKELHDITTASYQLAAKGLNQWANMFTKSSAAKSMVKKRFILSKSTSQPFDEPSVGIWEDICASKTLKIKFCQHSTMLRPVWET